MFLALHLWPSIPLFMIMIKFALHVLNDTTPCHFPFYINQICFLNTLISESYHGAVTFLRGLLFNHE